MKGSYTIKMYEVKVKKIFGEREVLPSTSPKRGGPNYFPTCKFYSAGWNIEWYLHWRGRFWWISLRDNKVRLDYAHEWWVGWRDHNPHKGNRRLSVLLTKELPPQQREGCFCPFIGERIIRPFQKGRKRWNLLNSPIGWGLGFKEESTSYRLGSSLWGAVATRIEPKQKLVLLKKVHCVGATASSGGRSSRFA